jgi:hypothetical protein
VSFDGYLRLPELGMRKDEDGNLIIVISNALHCQHSAVGAKTLLSIWACKCKPESHSGNFVISHQHL